MQPSSFPADLELLYRYWQNFTRSRVMPPGVDPLVGNSWRRCAPLLNPYGQPALARLNEDTLQRLLISKFNLLVIARPLMEDIYQFIEGGSALLAFLDSTGCVLLTLGDAAMQARAAAVGLVPGTFWDEGRMGTNAFALALNERTPAQVIGAEHFLACYHTLMDAAAPIFDPTGHPVGVFGLVCPVEKAHAHSIGIAAAGARALGNQLNADVFTLEANRHLTLLNATLESVSEGVLAWDNEGVITQLNKQAASLLGLNPRTALGHPLRQFVQVPPELQETISAGRSQHNIEAHLVVNGRPLHCMLNLVPIQPGLDEPIGYLATLQPIQQIHDLYHRLSGAQATLTFDDIRGHSPGIQRVRQQARTAARGRGNILLQGESGVGKHVVARAIHNASQRARGPFIAMNCRAIPRDLFLSEFLGYEGGAFSGARAEGRPSKFELASGGTLFLDEVEAIPLEFQSALGRVIESGEVMRLGGTRMIPVSLRIMASTDVNMDALVAEGNFQANLLYRLSSIVIDMPPLRERLEDLAELIETILTRLGRSHHVIPMMTPEALEQMQFYPWPGNVRELENVLERALGLIVADQPIDVEHLPEAVRRGGVISSTHDRVEPVMNYDEWNREAIMRAGWASHGNVTRMAAMLGISRTTLWRKMRAYDLDLAVFQVETTTYVSR